MAKFGIVYGHLEYITVIRYILWPLGNLAAIWYIFPPFWYIVSRKIWQPWLRVKCVGGWAEIDKVINNEQQIIGTHWQFVLKMAPTLVCLRPKKQYHVEKHEIGSLLLTNFLKP
jgi:hypothetical protein